MSLSGPSTEPPSSTARKASLMFEIQDFLRSPMDPNGAADVRERQNAQFQLASQCLNAAGELLACDTPDFQAVIATALVGLLAQQLSND